MSRRPQYGIRKLEDVDGGAIAWLYPDGADLDEVLVALASYLHDQGYVDWIAGTPILVYGPDPAFPDDWADRAQVDAYMSHGKPFLTTIDEDHPTDVLVTGEVEVGYYRRMPWCWCGEDHTWHFEPTTGPARGASLAVVVSNR